MKNNSAAKDQNQKGNKLKEEGKLEEAIACYQKAIEINPQLALSYFNLGQALVQQKKFDEAIEAYRKAIEINPKPPKFHQNLKDVLQQKKPTLKQEKINTIKGKALDLSEALKKFNSLQYKGQLLQDKWVVMMTQGKQKGIFLEIGSSDGVGLNNTFHLEKKFSWSGMCVEPNPDLFKKLCANRTVITLPYAFSKESGEIVEFVHHGVFGTIAKYSSADGHAAKRENFISEHGTIKVLTARPDFILELYKFPENFDFLSLDVEGAELEVLESFNLSKWHPALACIEHNYVEDRRFAIFELLSSHGYQCLQIQFDDWYYHPDILKILNPDIPVSYYQEVIEYFCKNHQGKLIMWESFKGDKKNQLIIALAKFIKPEEFNHAEAELFDSQEARMAYGVAKKFNLEWENLKDFEVYQLLAEALTNKGELEGAIACYEKTLELQPQLWGIYQKLADIYWQQKQLSSAVATLQKAIKLNPNFSWSYHKLGEALTQLQKWDEAVLAYSRAIEINPDFPWSYHKLGEVCSQLKKWDEAVVAYRQFLEKNSDFPWVYNKLGEALIKLKRWEEVVACYKKFIELQPSLAESYRKLGEALMQLEQWSEAAVAYHQFIKLNPDSYSFCQNLGRAFVNLKKWEKAEDFYLQAIEINSNNYEDYYELGEIYLQQKNWEQAISYFIKGLELNLNCFKIYHKLADILKIQGHKQAAYRCKYHHILPKTILVKFCQLPPDYAIESKTFPGIKYIEIYPATQIHLSPSKTINKNVVSNLKKTEIIAAPAFVAEIDEGRAWAQSSISAVITSENKLVTDICTGSAELVLSALKLRPCHSIDGTVAFFSLRLKTLGFFHWMFDVIARFDLLFRSGITISEIDKFVVNNCTSNFQKETLKILGVPEERVIESDSYPYIKAKKLIVPSIPGEAENNFRTTKWACDFIKDKFLDREALDKLPHKNQRIYISRNLASRRRVINEQEVVSLLEKFGFISVTLESMSVAEQALSLANAKVVVAPHGAGLTNLLFCQPGTKVVEFFSPESVIDFYWHLSNVCGLDYHYLIGDKFDDSYFSNPGCKDIQVNLDSLLKLMRLLEIV